MFFILDLVFYFGVGEYQSPGEFIILFTILFIILVENDKIITSSSRRVTEHPVLDVPNRLVWVPRIHHY